MRTVAEEQLPLGVLPQQLASGDANLAEQLER